MCVVCVMFHFAVFMMYVNSFAGKTSYCGTHVLQNKLSKLQENVVCTNMTRKQLVDYKCVCVVLCDMCLCVVTCVIVLTEVLFIFYFTSSWLILCSQLYWSVLSYRPVRTRGMSYCYPVTSTALTTVLMLTKVSMDTVLLAHAQ